MNGAIIIGGYIQGLSNVRALGEKGVPVWVLDTSPCLAQHSKYCKKYILCPSKEAKEQVEFLFSIAQQYPQTKDWLLIPSDDSVVIWMSKYKDKLQQYFKLVIPNETIINNIVNKKLLLQTALKVGTPIPETCYPENIEKAINFRYPVMIKGNYGLEFFLVNHKKAFRVDGYDELRVLLPKLIAEYQTSEMMVQEMIPFDPQHRVLSCTCFAIDGNIKAFWMGDKLRERPLQFGTATLARSVMDEQVLKDVKPLIMELKYTGVCEVEMLRDPRDGQYKLIEINPRTWMWVGLAKECGVEYAWMLYCYANHLNVQYPTSYPTDIKWRNAYTDIPYSYKAMAKHLLSYKEYRNSLQGKVISAFWDKHDIMPGLYFPILMVKNVIGKIIRIIKKKLR